ncbi:MAG: TlpA disulfide reductase family protein [Niabella sp.]
MKYLFTFLLVCISATVPGQKVQLLELDVLENRIANGKDTFYIINYWATWCAPCIKEIPYFNKFQKAYLNKPVKVLLISLDFLSQYQKAVVPFVRKQKLETEVFLLNEKDQQQYIDRISTDWSGALPATAFICQHKNIKRFFEQEFTYDELVQTFNSLQ